MRIVVALLLLAAVLAGCTGGPAEFVTAGSLVKEAQERADAELDDARLIAMFSAGATDTALGKLLAGGNADHWILNFFRKPDPDVADGRFQAWGFMFRAAEGNETLGIVLGPGGKTFRALDTSVAAGIFSRFTPAADEGLGQILGETLGNWSLDSDEATSRVRDADANFSRVAASEGAVGWAILNQDVDLPGPPVWTVGVDFLEVGAGNESVGIVNAQTGAIIDVGALLDEPLVPAEGAFLTGFATVTEPDEQSILVGLAGHRWLGFQFYYAGRPTHWPVVVTFWPEDGYLTEWRPDTGVEYNDAFVEIPAAGTWRITVALDTEDPPIPPPTRANQGFTLGWCASSGPQAPISTLDDCKPLLFGEGSGNVTA